MCKCLNYNRSVGTKRKRSMSKASPRKTREELATGLMWYCGDGWEKNYEFQNHSSSLGETLYQKKQRNSKVELVCFALSVILSIHYVPSTLLEIGNTVINKTGKVSCACGDRKYTK